VVCKHVDVFALGDLLNIRPVERLLLVGFWKGIFKFVSFPLLLLCQVVVVVVSAYGATRIIGVFQFLFVVYLNDLSVLMTEHSLKSGHNTR